MKNLNTIIAAIQFIEANLTCQKIDLECVATAVHYSKTHLHRIFTGTVGLTIHDYVQRRQLTVAAKLLIFSEKSILDIALLSGYESQQAFSGIFKMMYKVSPHQFRRNEVFYPLQLEYHFERQRTALAESKNTDERQIRFANDADIPAWMELVHLAIDGFPYLEDEQHITVLRKNIAKKEALIMTVGELVVGNLMINRSTGSIDFLAVHPLFQKQGISQEFLQTAIVELLTGKEISITTFREGDKADTGYRKALKELGFAEGELLTEFGYPTQRLVLPQDAEVPFPDEVSHLKEINTRLNTALLEADANVAKIDGSYMDAKRYMAQYRGEIDPHEMFQNELALKQIDGSGAFAVSVRDQIFKLKDSPYFARIDFRDEADQAASSYYIGRFAFRHKNEMHIFDWRAPISSMFYNCEVGLAGYDAPKGRIEGELTRKRQFKIKNGKLEYAIETSSNIQDDVLQRELSQTSDEKMKSIIATIQKEQNIIIRNEQSETLIIQGVAGSGKTSIALHRIAFLLYRFKNKLSSQNVTILSPNKVFGDYISGVLPELGEEPIFEWGFTDIAEIQLEGVIGFESDKDFLETDNEMWAQRARFKSTLHFVKLIDEYIAQMSDFVFEPKDYTFGRFTIHANTLTERFHAYKAYPIKQRLPMIADDIYDRLDTDNVMEDNIPSQKTILKALNNMLKFKNTLALYKEFYKRQDISSMFVMPAPKTLEWIDVFPFLYLHAAFQGLLKSGIIRHLVVDEMQDYTPIQYAVINQIFPCPKTILGDFNQSLNPNHRHTLDTLCQLYPDAKLVELNKSYRSTYEIIQLAKQIQPAEGLEVMERHGEPPTISACRGKDEELAHIRRQINDFLSGTNISLGIILKTNSAAKIVYEQLKDDYCLTLITPESNSYQNGITLTSIQMSKGLEFDEVLIPQADDNMYTTVYDRSLLYIACTRAMHRLSLSYSGKRSRLLP